LPRDSPPREFWKNRRFGVMIHPLTVFRRRTLKAAFAATFAVIVTSLPRRPPANMAKESTMNSSGIEDYPGMERFSLVRRLGAGGMGVVYEAHDRARDIRVALKTLPRFDARALYLFKQEFRALSDVVHPNLVALHELFSIGERWFFTMELVHGVNFIDYVRFGRQAFAADVDTGVSRDTARDRPVVDRSAAQTPSGPPSDQLPDRLHGNGSSRKAGPSHGAESPATNSSTSTVAHTPESGEELTTKQFTRVRPFDAAAEVGRETREGTALTPDQLERLRAVLQQLAEGICALHEAGKLHRDIKPSNVLVTEAGRVVLLDFGLVAELEVRPLEQDVPELVCGTANYMAPEQAAGLALSTASDWYSVGVMMYEALTGRLPIAGSSLQVLRDKQERDITPPSRIVPAVPGDLEALCLQMLQRRPQDRPCEADILRRLKSASVASTGISLPHVPQRTPFVGRERHLAALAEALQATRQRRTVTMFVHGRSGVGKSLLLQRFLEGLLEREEVVVLAGRCYEQESVPYKALDSLVDALSRYLRRLSGTEATKLLPRDVAALTRVFPVLRRVEAVVAARQEAGHIPDQQELRRRAFAALRELLTRLGESKPLVLFIDDLQWGDVDSAALLSDLLRPPDPPVLLLVGSYRSEYAATSACLKVLLEAAAKANTLVDRRDLAVEPLEVAEARTLALELLGGGKDAATAARAQFIAQESGGNPYFVRELVQSLQEGAELRQATITAEKVTLEEVLWRRVRGLPDASRRLLEVVTVSGRPLRQGEAYRAAELASADRTALALLRVGHLVRSTGPGELDEVESYHDRIRETVVAHLPPEELKQHHRRLAGTLEATGHADPETLAVHFQGAHESEKAGGYYMLAADEAAEALAFARAAKLYRLALELRRMNDADARTMRVRLADALANAGRGVEAAREYQAAAEGAGAAQALDLQRRAAYQYCCSGYVDQGRKALSEVLARVGMKLPATPARTLLSLMWARFRLWLRGLRYRERRADQVPAQDLTRIDVAWSASAGVSMLDMLAGALFQTHGLLLALKAGEPYRLARSLAWESAHTANGGIPSMTRARMLLDASRLLAERIDQPHALGMLQLAEGIAHFTLGSFAAACERLEQAESIFRDRCTGATWEMDTAQAFILWTRLYMGDFVIMNRRSSQLLKEALERGDLYAATNFATFPVPVARLVEGNPEEARRILNEFLGQWSHEAFHLQHLTALMGNLYIDFYKGEGAVAWARIRRDWPAVVRSQFLRVKSIQLVMTELRARAALAAARTAAQPAPLLKVAAQAAHHLEQLGMTWSLPKAHLLGAQIAFLRGDRSEALSQLGRAATGCDTVPLGMFAAAVRRRRGELLGGDEGSGLINQANAWMTTQNVQDPARLTAAYAPAFGD
jgi:serine/threonine protein kinase